MEKDFTTIKNLCASLPLWTPSVSGCAQFFKAVERITANYPTLTWSLLKQALQAKLVPNDRSSAIMDSLEDATSVKDAKARINTLFGVSGNKAALETELSNLKPASPSPTTGSA